ncbi:uncharacterized protein M6B38_249805 [Iris pallida]|uniref:FLZ-type domain-containing protein n=1 Tax=Iris pallida TaxID=29817 RepID=A0AAX6IJR0_IRIPA|nr:uncharacterized protein M6B38_249800 [Iris pallida]KAJ6853507.1 uncharacterized protein M6B38_249805 [Iris pallida]
MEKPYSSFESLSSAAPSFSPFFTSSSRARSHHHHRRRLFDDDDEVSPRHFLDSCFFCKKPLGVAYGRDIFMYRGDTPFCSEECRQEQIEIDESFEKKSKKSSSKSSAAKSEKINVRSAAGVAAGVVAG